jgi:hypothetical protein
LGPHDNFGPGDKMVYTHLDSPHIDAQAFVTLDGKHKILLLSKRDRSFDLALPGAEGAQVRLVDQTTSLQPPAISGASLPSLNLRIPSINWGGLGMLPMGSVGISMGGVYISHLLPVKAALN